ncbi:MAG: uracil-DNA glycosylase [Gammaproteobacteria bacterium]|nr:uracil-DNA glycosylase [Gammaproteobacteria bacterium]MDH3856690.1 uracil-DNA glycosylase [Gammaproteobacteria bacterium]
MSRIDTLIERSGVHDDWQQILVESLLTLDPDYLESLLQDDSWLPGIDRLLAAFRRDRTGVGYLLIGESPYPRPESANGIAFYDAAVGNLWSEKGLSKAVNRATSLRNIVKTALVAEGHLQKDSAGKITQESIAGLDKGGLIQTLIELFANLERAGFLMLNATPVLHPGRKPAWEARHWQEFLIRLLALIAKNSTERITLLLWGRIAKLLEDMPASGEYDKLVCEHPYNISFIDNPDMLQLFAELRVLQKHATVS